MDETAGNCPEEIIPDPSDEYYKVWNNRTAYLAAGKICRITVNATLGMTRFVLTNTTDVGVDLPGYLTDGHMEIIVPQGQVYSFNIYNGRDNRTSYSAIYGYGIKGATMVTAGSVAAALALITVLI